MIRPKPNNVPVPLIMPEKIKLRIEEIAEEEERSLCAWIRYAIKKQLETYKENNND